MVLSAAKLGVDQYSVWPPNDHGQLFLVGGSNISSFLWLSPRVVLCITDLFLDIASQDMCGASKSAGHGEEPPALSLGDLKILVLDEADRMLSEASSSEAVFCGVKGKPQGSSLAEFRFGLLLFYFFGIGPF